MNKQERIVPEFSLDLLLAACFNQPIVIDDQEWFVSAWQKKSYGNRFELLHSNGRDHMIAETSFASDRVTTYTIERS